LAATVQEAIRQARVQPKASSSGKKSCSLHQERLIEKSANEMLKGG